MHYKILNSPAIAYGSVIYYVNGNKINLISSKPKVAPLKTLTLPQLDLTAIYLGVKIVKYTMSVLCHIEVNHVIIWSDNEPALQWIRNNNSNTIYIKNGVSKLREMTDSYKFFHVSSNRFFY